VIGAALGILGSGGKRNSAGNDKHCGPGPDL
jgi:hypothetical protein